MNRTGSKAVAIVVVMWVENARLQEAFARAIKTGVPSRVVQTCIAFYGLCDVLSVN